MKKTNIALIAILSLIPIFHTKITAQLPSYLPTNGLVAWYPFNGNANDESGNGTNGIVNGATLVPNRFGQSNSAYSFDGINDFIQYPQGSNTPINIVGDISFGYWIKTTSTEGIITSFGDQLAGQGGYLSGLRDGSAEPSPGRLGYWVGGTWITSSALINDNNWTFIMVTYTGGQLKLYVNGNLDSQHSGMPAASWNGNRTLGKPNYVDVRFFSGLIDDFVIYSRALSATEINILYTANSGNNTSNTVNPAPPGIPYQAEVRNESGEVLANANVNVRFTLHELTSTGTVSYQETQALTTNEIGLFAATIGAGTAVQGTFASINWAQTTKFLQVEVDTDSGWITMGNQQLMSVPYALYAANSQPGPQGPIGLTGQPGPQGEQGPTGAPGISGQQGANGLNSLIKTSNEPAGNNCNSGGIKIETGLDLNSDGNLDNIEINNSQTQFICGISSFSLSHGIKLGYSQSATWTCPSDVFQVQVELWGAGGGGSSYSYSSDPNFAPSCYGNKVGGKGGYNRQIINVTPGNTYEITIGLGGCQTSPGGGSAFGSILFAQGGGGASGVNGIDGSIINWPYSNNVASQPGYIPSGLYFNNTSAPSVANGGNGSCSCLYSLGQNGFCILNY
jgi:hypothetical protein